jgi:hypothetical protein
MRALTPPPYQMGCITAANPGSGKTLLAKILKWTHGAVFRAEMPTHDEEFGKNATSILLTTTSPVVWIDNVTGTLKSPNLAALLTTDTWSGRVLGYSRDTGALPNDRLWVVTGNNLILGGDIPRRALMVTIDPGRPHPELRVGFRETDLESYVRARRADIVAAGLTLIRGWVLAGRPADEWRSDYGLWTASLRGLLQWAGLPGTFAHEATAPVQDGSENDEWGVFLLACRRVFGNRPFTTKDVADSLLSGFGVERAGGPGVGGPGTGEALGASHLVVDDLPTELADRRERSPGSWTKSLGRWLLNRAGRWVEAGLCVERGHAERGQASWLIKVSDPMDQENNPGG